jgi:magnesium transporter
MERPKIDEDEDYLFVVMHFPHWDAAKALSRAREVDIFVGRGYVVTIHDGILRPLIYVWEKCEKDEEYREKLLGRGANHAFYTIIDQLVDYIFPILRKVDGNIRRIEEDIFTADTRVAIREISLVRRDVISLRRIIRQQVPIVEQLERVEHPIIHDDLEEYFGDIADHLYKARDIIDENFEIISSLAETADTLASHRINEVMRILTVLSVIMLPLTLLSSIYGMNFARIPLDNHPQGFWIISLIMVLLALGLLAYFRRRGWL